MPRARNRVASRQRRKKVLGMAKGYWGSRSKVYTVAKHAVDKGLEYSYRDRRKRKQQFRRLWIARINAAARLHGTTYSRLSGALRKQEIALNRKVLADLAMNEPAAFARVVQEAHQADDAIPA
ncbi:MAG: 50S ribosomal protein L20 [Rhodothermaceae bacterium]|nr:50S ribosomal protein L20 [Bacteroidota bacterium]MXX97977.1 50S ribosomal protein L20 [Rhodothermaceae bacterium]MCY3595315.1 50S ribosomal protein L20 [Bacteroidota bacterium]MXZ58361.1 50S ribosomal protein L20 [Rhodothermaceae bacterium]MYB91592.1 50S ribosomal protein L20 [Rhodothermaceae bacterium]